MNQRSLKAISLEEWGETLGSALTAFSEKCGGKGLRLFPQITKEKEGVATKRFRVYIDEGEKQA